MTRRDDRRPPALFKRVRAALGLKVGRATSKFRVLPDYLIIGVQKGGTTSLYNHLARHPDISKARRKEVHFFDVHYSKGEGWYRSFFPLRLTRDLHARKTGRRLQTGEATPSYVFHPLAPARVSGLLPDARFIVLLRDPVTRAISHYHHMRSRGRETLHLEDALHAEEERLDQAEDRIIRNPEDPIMDYLYFSYVSRGFYARQLRRWFSYIDRKRFLILKSESLFHDSRTTVIRICDFLGLKRHDLGDMTVFNKGRYRTETIDPGIKERLYSMYSDDNEELKELTGICY